MRRQYMGAAAFAVAAGLAAALAVAPTAMSAVGETGKQDERELDKIEVIILKRAELNASGVPVSASLSELTGRSAAKGLEKVRLLGHARVQKTTEGTVGQVVWYGVTADVEGSEKKAGLRTPLKSAFITPSGQLPNETRLQAQGDVDGMLDVAHGLLKKAEVEEEEEEEEEEKEEKQQQRQANNQVGGGAPQNPLANQYEPLRIPDRQETPELATSQIVSTDGCSPRVDLDAGMIYPTSKIMTMENGAVKEQSECSDSSAGFPVRWSTAACDVDIDLEAMRAYPNGQPYFVGSDGLPVYVAECQRMADEEFVIARDDDSCSPLIDLDALTASLRYQLVYTSASGAVNVVQSCEVDPEAILTIAERFDGCSYRHENNNNVSFRQSRYGYSLETGEERIVSACADTGSPIPHEFDISACEPAVDLTGSIVTPLARRQISTETGVIVIAGCAPMESMITAIEETTVGCEFVLSHDTPAGVSYPTSRFYYELEGEQTFVTDCEIAAVPPLPHQYETVNWQLNDPAREAKPVERIYVNAPAGEIEVVSGTVRDGVPAVPYIFERTEIQPALPDKYWEGCNAWVPQNNVEVFQRPDTTEVAYVIDAAEASGPVDECLRTAEYEDHVPLNTRVRGGNNPSGYVSWVGGGSTGTRTWKDPWITYNGKRASGCTNTKYNSIIHWQSTVQNLTRDHLVFPDGAEGYSDWVVTSSTVHSGSCTGEINDNPGPEH